MTRIMLDTSAYSAFMLGHSDIKVALQEADDIWIAASAMQHGLSIITTDVHYEKVPQVITACFSV